MTKEKIFDFVILCLRWYLAFYMISYGWGKMTMSQFGVHSEQILDMPLREVDDFYVAWHLYGESKFFNYVTGIAEILAGVLLIFNRTVLLGALLVLSILAQIFIIDVSFTTGQQGYALPVRILGMIISALLILYYYKDRMIQIFHTLTSNVSTRFKYKWWVFILLPVIGFLMDFIWAIFLMPLKMGLDKMFLG